MRLEKKILQIILKSKKLNEDLYLLYNQNLEGMFFQHPHLILFQHNLLKS